MSPRVHSQHWRGWPHKIQTPCWAGLDPRSSWLGPQGPEVGWLFTKEAGAGGRAESSCFHKGERQLNSPSDCSTETSITVKLLRLWNMWLRGQPAKRSPPMLLPCMRVRVRAPGRMPKCQRSGASQLKLIGEPVRDCVSKMSKKSQKMPASNRKRKWDCHLSPHTYTGVHKNKHTIMYVEF